MDKQFSVYSFPKAGQIDLHVSWSGLSLWAGLSAQEARDLSIKLALQADVVDPVAPVEPERPIAFRVFRWFYPSRR